MSDDANAVEEQVRAVRCAEVRCREAFEAHDAAEKEMRRTEWELGQARQAFKEAADALLISAAKCRGRA